MKTKLLFSLPSIILGILIAIAPMTFVPVCSGSMEHMDMHGDHSTMKMDDDSMKNMDKKDMDKDSMKDMDKDSMKNMDKKDMDKGETQALQVAPNNLVKTHGGHMEMRCHWTAQASLGIGIVIAILGILVFFADPRMRAGLNIAVVLVSALEIAIANWLIGMCPGMHCDTVTKPTLTLLALLALVLSAVFAYLDLRRPLTATAKQGVN